MKTVGYLINTSEGPAGEPGLFYDYILAGNGLYVRASSPQLRATVPVAPVTVRGLAPLEETVELPQGRIPSRLYQLALSVFAATPEKERYLAITWEDGYKIRDPVQEGHGASVTYEVIPGTVLDIHSHGIMSAFFSGQDNTDEQGLRLYMVVGRLNTLIPEYELRVGVYGYFATLWFNEVFGV